MYQALYRKWRPRTFDDVVGQGHITETLKRQVAAGRLSHAYLFTGTRGTGKTTCAKILARAVNCEHPVNGNPCNQCPSCLGIENGSILDVLELDAASNNGVDQVRALRDEAVYTPAAVRKRVYIVDEVHMLSSAAFNALLKILEEPPEHLMFILATTELHKVPATIKSRCQQFSFKRILPGDIAARLAYVAREEGLELRGEGAALLARLADGGLRDALSLLDQCAVADRPIGEQEVLDALGLAGNLETAGLMEQIGNGDTAGALETLGRLYGAGKEIGSLLNELAALARDLLIRKTAPKGGAPLLTGGYDENTMRKLSNLFQTARLAQILGLLQSTIAELPRSGNRRTDAELCLIRLCEPSLDESMSALNARLSRVEELLAGGVPAACAVPATPQKRPQNSGTRRETRQAVPADAGNPPWEEERPPLPEEPGEPGERVLLSGEPPAKLVEQPKEINYPQEQAVSGETLWPGLVTGIRGKFPAEYPFLSNPASVQGRIEDGVLTLWVIDEFIKDMVGKASILEELARLASTQVGKPVRCTVKVGKAPAEQAASQQKHDNLDDLLALGRQFDNIIIEE
ncbi:DNA polymerase III subunit gamma/tau [Pseudoflavonifractor phocaeensis]|uniref:DNA polymerase III subunit gamma/tau n=1 Tax=Pseudoflavonifractor phocaeensis TaxID=1870988 RepID=UPI00195C0E01|nr:DNA polymerase III subunit gamma/tau [Pseudoflavonifractor phocaeensis]MBM6723493.1 DNA polymerase III subunit gamma/tau [Pseudoflavonifractor phocaeensis]